MRQKRRQFSEIREEVEDLLDYLGVLETRVRDAGKPRIGREEIKKPYAGSKVIRICFGFRHSCFGFLCHMAELLAEAKNRKGGLSSEKVSEPTPDFDPSFSVTHIAKFLLFSAFHAEAPRSDRRKN